MSGMVMTLSVPCHSTAFLVWYETDKRRGRHTKDGRKRVRSRSDEVWGHITCHLEQTEEERGRETRNLGERRLLDKRKHHSIECKHQKTHHVPEQPRKKQKTQNQNRRNCQPCWKQLQTNKKNALLQCLFRQVSVLSQNLHTVLDFLRSAFFDIADTLQLRDGAG